MKEPTALTSLKMIKSMTVGRLQEKTAIIQYFVKVHLVYWRNWECWENLRLLKKLPASLQEIQVSHSVVQQLNIVLFVQMLLVLVSWCNDCNTRHGLEGHSFHDVCLVPAMFLAPQMFLQFPPKFLWNHSRKR